MTNFVPIPDPDPKILQQLVFGSEEDDVYRRLVNRKRAEERYRQEQEATQFRPFYLNQTLADHAAAGIAEPQWLIDRLCERNANVLIQGDAKAGKSTLQMEALRCLAEGQPMFGAYSTARPDGRIAYIDFEMGLTKTLQRLTKVRMSQGAMERIAPVSLVGTGFSLTSDAAYAHLVEQCKAANVKVAVFDPLMHIAAKDSENDNSEIQRIVDRLNRFKLDAGVETIFAPAHTAKNSTVKPGEPLSVRGASVWNGWAGHMWNAYYVEQKNERWFKLGASREMPPDDDPLLKARIVSMGSDGTLMLKSSAPRPSNSSDLDRAILAAIRDQPGCSGNHVVASVEAVETHKAKVLGRMRALEANCDLACDASSKASHRWFLYADAPWHKPGTTVQPVQDGP